MREPLGYDISHHPRCPHVFRKSLMIALFLVCRPRGPVNCGMAEM